MSLCLTKNDLAKACGYSYRRLHDIDSALPSESKLFVKGDEGKYDLSIFVQRWVKYQIENATAGVDDLETAKAIHEKVKIKKTELEVSKMEGTLLDVNEIKRLWGEIINTAKTNLLRMPQKVAPLLVMMDSIEEISGIISDHIITTLEAIAETPIADRDDEEKEDEETEE